MGACRTEPERRFSISSRNAELSIIASGDGGMTAKLLVVDDEPRTAELTAEILRRAGYSVDVAGSGTEALERVGLGTPGLMLLDHQMPGMEAAQGLHSPRSRGEPRALPVLLP